MAKRRKVISLIGSQSAILTSSNTQATLAVLQGGSVAVERLTSLKDKVQRGGSQPGRSCNLAQDFEGGHQQLFDNYFADRPIYSDYYFWRRFRMHQPLFLKIVSDIENHDNYFSRKADAVGKLGLYPIQKITSALRIIAYGNAADANDEYLWISESTSHESLDHFCQAVIDLYSSEYLPSPNEKDVK